MMKRENSIRCSILAEKDFLPSENCSLAEENPTENLFNDDDCLLIDHTGLLNVFHTLTRANYNRVRSVSYFISLSSNLLSVKTRSTNFIEYIQ